MTFHETVSEFLNDLIDENGSNYSKSDLKNSFDFLNKYC